MWSKTDVDRFNCTRSTPASGQLTGSAGQRSSHLSIAAMATCAFWARRMLFDQDLSADLDNQGFF